jgi:hypothetical protein
MQDNAACIIADELNHPDKYKPIARGPVVALLLVFLLGSMVPIWVAYKTLKKWLSTRHVKH